MLTHVLHHSLFTNTRGCQNAIPIGLSRTLSLLCEVAKMIATKLTHIAEKREVFGNTSLHIMSAECDLLVYHVVVGPGTKTQNVKALIAKEGFISSKQIPPQYTIVVAKCHMLFVRVWANGYGVLKSVFGATYDLTNLWLCAHSGPTNSYLGRVGD